MRSKARSAVTAVVSGIAVRWQRGKWRGKWYIAEAVEAVEAVQSGGSDKYVNMIIKKARGVIS